MKHDRPQTACAPPGPNPLDGEIGTLILDALIVDRPQKGSARKSSILAVNLRMILLVISRFDGRRLSYRRIALEAGVCDTVAFQGVKSLKRAGLIVDATGPRETRWRPAKAYKVDVHALRAAATQGAAARRAFD